GSRGPPDPCSSARELWLPSRWHCRRARLCRACLAIFREWLDDYGLAPHQIHFEGSSRRSLRRLQRLPSRRSIRRSARLHARTVGILSTKNKFAGAKLESVAENCST